MAFSTSTVRPSKAVPFICLKVASILCAYNTAYFTEHGNISEGRRKYDKHRI